MSRFAHFIEYAAIVGIMCAVLGCAHQTGVVTSSSASATPRWLLSASTKPIYKNHIFASAFVYRLECVGTASTCARVLKEMGGDRAITFSMQAALTDWGSALLIEKQANDSLLAKYVESHTYGGANSGRSVYTAPPVMLGGEGDSVNFVIRIVADRSTPFPIHGIRVLAAAQLEGRTILLNAQREFFMYSPILDAWSKSSKINLTPVFTHELGHAFGLRHRDDRVPSVMSTDPALRTPYATMYDGRELRRVLSLSVPGSPPGVFSAVTCDGLSIETDEDPNSEY